MDIRIFETKGELGAAARARRGGHCARRSRGRGRRA